MLLGQAVRALEFLDGLPEGATPIALPALAAKITGDTKALNHGTALATLVLRALALRAQAPRPVTAAERRDLWDRAGVLVNDLASRVLVLNVAAEGEGLGDWLTGAARYGTPFQVTLHQLAAHPIRLRLARLFACENPAVLRRACVDLGVSCPPLVCTEGQPSTAFHRLIAVAVDAGAELWYHGDFDWPGVAIAADLVVRYRARPWRMDARDYEAAVKANGMGVDLGASPGRRPGILPCVRRCPAVVTRSMRKLSLISFSPISVTTGRMPKPSLHGDTGTGARQRCSARRHPPGVRCSQASGLSRVGGRPPSSPASRLSAARLAIARRVSTVADPRCGMSTAFSQSSSPG